MDTLPRRTVGVIGRPRTAVDGGLHRQTMPSVSLPGRQVSSWSMHFARYISACETGGFVRDRRFRRAPSMAYCATNYDLTPTAWPRRLYLEMVVSRCWTSAALPQFDSARVKKRRPTPCAVASASLSVRRAGTSRPYDEQHVAFGVARVAEPQPHPLPPVAFTSASRAQHAVVPLGAGPPQHALVSR